jgi:hypothetical protein
METSCDELEATGEAYRTAIRAARENPEDSEAQAHRDQAKERFLELCNAHLPTCKPCRKKMNPSPIISFLEDLWLPIGVLFEMFWKPGLAVLAVGGIIGLVWWTTSAEASGSFQSHGGRLGDWTLSPDDCSSGERDGFHGVWLFGGDGPEKRLQLVKNPGFGYIVRIPVPGTCDADGDCEAVVLTESSCDTLDADVHRDKGHTQTNDVYHLEGHVRLDCEIEGGARLSGEAVFEDCH